MGYKILLFLLSISTINAYQINNFGKSTSTIFINKINRNEAQEEMGQNKISKGIKALRAIDLIHAIKKVKNTKLGKKKSKIDGRVNDKYFVVAEVGGDIITNIDVLNAIKFIFFVSHQQYNKKYAKLMVKPVLKSLIDDKVRYKFALMQKINTDDIIKDKINELAKSNKLTVEELAHEFEKAGINLTIYKKNLISRILFNAFFEDVRKSIKISQLGIENEKRKLTNQLKERRYKLSKIVLKITNKKEEKSVYENAQSILELLQNGFNFNILAETISQDADNNNEWICESNLSKNVLEAINDLPPGQWSQIIKENNSYEIIQVIDKAEPNQSGQEDVKYTVLTTELPIKVDSQSEMFNLQKEIELLSQASDLQSFIRICKAYNLKTVEREITKPDPYELELINRNKKGTTGILKIDDHSPIKCLFIKSETSPKAKLPSDSEIEDLLLRDKAINTFNKFTQQINAHMQISINEDMVAKVI